MYEMSEMLAAIKSLTSKSWRISKRIILTSSSRELVNYLSGIKQFLCFRLLSGEKVRTGRKYIRIFLFLFYGMSCMYSQQLINNKLTPYLWELK